jgi:hypothetical protein
MKLSRRVLSVAVIVLTVMGCSKSVNVPLDQVESVQDRKARHRIHVRDGDEFAVRRFTVTDSTIVIDDLSPTDIRFDAVDLPIVLRRSDVVAIERVEGRGQLFFIVIPAAVVLLLIGWATASR